MKIDHSINGTHFKRGITHIVLFLLVMIALSECSTKKNTVLTRTYHNITAHYNVYFNGHEALKSGEKKIENAYPDDYSKVLPVFKSSDPRTDKTATTDMNVAIDKSIKLIKLHSITKKPALRGKMTDSYREFASKTEFNRWVPEAYLMMGQAYFFQHKFSSAISNFSLLIRNYKDASCRYDALLWLVRGYVESERFSEAQDQLVRLEADPGFPKRLQGDLAAVTADLYIRLGKNEEAISYLQTAIKLIHQRKAKIRYHFILAQLYHETGKEDLAATQYQQVVKMHPPYEMAFYAQINTVLASSDEASTDKLIGQLKKMLTSNNNRDYFDLIHFALGNIYQKKGETDLAINHYKLASVYGTNNNVQKTQTCITLANLYFSKKKYIPASCYYDSAMLVLDNQDPSYKLISDRATGLENLVQNLRIYNKEDSLQRLAKMSTSDRNKLIDQWIVLAKAKKRKEDQQKEFPANQQTLISINSISGQDASVFYFYSPTTIAYGKKDFERLWGKRKLEDNWRRKDKKANMNSSPEEADQKQITAVTDSLKKQKTDSFSREFYMAEIPVNDSLMLLSNERLKTSLFQAARILKNEFADYTSSTELFLELLKRFPGNEYELSAYFDLYEEYTTLNNSSLSSKYKNLIISKYPQSKYALYLLNPKYLIELQSKNDNINRIYEQAFSLFKQKKYTEVTSVCNRMITMGPDSLLKPKIEFLKAVSEPGGNNNQLLASNLKHFVHSFPNSEPKPLADEILKLINMNAFTDYQKLVESGYLSNVIKNDEIKSAANKNDECGGKFSYDSDLLHYFVIAFPANVSVDLNRLRYDIANYNIDHYTKIDFDINTENLNPQTKLVSVRSIEDKDHALIYFRSIIRKKNVFQTLNKVSYVNFIISSSNYRTLLNDKNYDDYLRFFIKNYSHFTQGNFSQEEIDEAPETLMNKLSTDNQPKEKGSYVIVPSATTGTSQGRPVISDATFTRPHAFILAIYDSTLTINPIRSAFDLFNKQQFSELHLSIDVKQISGLKLLIIKDLPNASAAMDYFKKIVDNRNLFNHLSDGKYRNFVIEKENLSRLSSSSDVDSYISVFRDKYLKK